MKPAYFSACEFRRVRRTFARNWQETRRAHSLLVSSGLFLSASVVRDAKNKLARDWSIARHCTPRIGPPIQWPTSGPFKVVDRDAATSYLFAPRDPQRAPAAVSTLEPLAAS